MDRIRDRLAVAFVRWSNGDRRPGLYWYGALARPLAVAYRLLEWINRSWRRNRVLPGLRRARLVVISSPLVGGVGKTPLTAHLASELKQQGLRVAIVTLGYRREARGTFSLSDAGDVADAAAVGDEALELWRTIGVPVHVGDEPAEVIAELDRPGNLQAILFDDGISRRWEGERRVVVLSARDLERPVHFLPAGRWRTTPRVVAHGCAVAITTAGDVPADLCDRHRRILSGWSYDGPAAWFATRVTGLGRLNPAAGVTGTSPADAHPYVFCGLGMPPRFLEQVQAAGLVPGGVRRFADHHRYRPEDLEELERDRDRCGCTWFLTTYKDAVKIDPKWLGSTPAYFLRISLQQVAGDDLLRVITERE